MALANQDLLQVVTTGRNEIKVGIPYGATREKLGETQDMTNVQEQPFFHNVPGDRHGGPQGPPIEVQWLGSIVNISFDLSMFVPSVLDKVRKRAVNATIGQISLAEVGSLMLLSRSIELELLTPNRGLLFPCAIAFQPIEYGVGTKYQSVRMGFQCHRAPEGHTQQGVLYTQSN